MTLCCFILTALSALSLDLSSTATFTRQGGREINPVGAWLVEGPGSHGEAINFAVASVGYLAADRSPRWRWVVWAGAIGHTTAVWWNARQGWVGSGAILVPVVWVQF